MHKSIDKPVKTIKIFFLPFAGGNSFSYRRFQDLSPKNIEVVTVELPGRGKRLDEPLLKDINEIVDDIFQQVLPYTNKPYAVFGHSMGGKLGYLLAKKITKNRLPKPLHLFFTGSSGPSIKKKDLIRHLLPKPDFLKELRRLGGSPEEILEDAEIFSFFEPILRADFQAIDTYDYEESIALDIPITVVRGLDEKITLEEVMAWQKETKRKLVVKQLPGDHFFIFDNASNLLAMMDQALFFSV